MIRKAEREKHKAKWLASGLSKKAYSESVGIKYATFISWFKQGSGLGKFEKLEVKGVEEELEIVLPNGIRIYSRQRLDANLLKVLRSV